MPKHPQMRLDPPAPMGSALDEPSSVVRWVAAVMVLVFGAWYSVIGGVTVGTVLALGLGPVILPVIRRFRGATVLFAVWIAAISAGLVLAVIASVDHDVLTHVARDRAFQLLGVAIGVPVVLWARTMWRDGYVALFFGMGMLLTSATSLNPVNPWKFTLAIPVAVIVLAVAWLTGRWYVDVGALLAIGALCMLNDSRSMFGVVLMAAALIAWQAWRSRKSRRGNAMGLFLLLGALGAGAYQLGQALALEGVLGEAAAERSARQIEQSGSLLIGSRPEMGATGALMNLRFRGFGLGVVPRGDDLRAAKEGMAILGYDPNNGYVERYMFGSGIEVHSVVGDFWAWAGPTGLVLGVVVAVVLVRGLVTQLALRAASGLIVLLCLRGLWDLLFAPFYSTMVYLTLILGLLLEPVLRRDLPGLLTAIPAPAQVIKPSRLHGQSEAPGGTVG